MNKTQKEKKKTLRNQHTVTQSSQTQKKKHHAPNWTGTLQRLQKPDQHQTTTVHNSTNSYLAGRI